MDRYVVKVKLLELVNIDLGLCVSMGRIRVLAMIRVRIRV